MNEGLVHATAIAGASLLELGVIPTPGGDVMHMLRPDFPLMPGKDGDSGHIVAGEVYFSEVLPGHVKAWKRHARQTQHFVVPVGRLGLALYDARPSSLTRGQLVTLVLGRPDNYCLLRIPCGVWYGFCALDDRPALVCNAVDMPHDPAEGERMDPESPEGRCIPFDWKAPFPCQIRE